MVSASVSVLLTVTSMVVSGVCTQTPTFAGSATMTVSPRMLVF